jgi:hypothetical protein
LRSFSGTRSNLANGNYQNLSATLSDLNYSTAFNPTLPPIPSGVRGQVLRHNGLPENFIRTNPQFANAHQVASMNHNNYHAMVAALTLRPTAGTSLQSTYTWSKNHGIFGEVGTAYTNPLDRHGDYALLADTRVHDFRTNGTFALPVGPGRPLLGNSTGTAARIVEDWSLSWIVTLSSGAPQSLVAQDMLYDHGTADIVGPFDPSSRKVEFATGDNFGSYFGTGLLQVPDPQCGRIDAGLQSACTLNAIADS